MSRAAETGVLSTLSPPVCEFCGGYIEEPGQDYPALDEGGVPAMSRGQNFSRFNSGARSFLEADVGPVDDEDCAVGPCDEDAVYRVPWPQFGGDVAYCPYHLARYRSDYSKEFHRVQQHVDDYLSALATRGERFLSLVDVPTKIRGGRYRRVGLTELGYARYEQVEPDEDGLVTYVLIDRTLGYNDALQVPSERAGSAPRIFLDALPDPNCLFSGESISEVWE